MASLNILSIMSNLHEAGSDLFAVSFKRAKI